MGYKEYLEKKLNESPVVANAPRRAPICDIIPDPSGDECDKVDMSIGQSIADELGVIFDGYQRIGEAGGWYFSDPLTNGSFVAKDKQNAIDKLAKLRADFGDKF